MRRGSPLPIPNREVKPDCADGTAVMWESMSPPFFEKPVLLNRLFCFQAVRRSHCVRIAAFSFAQSGIALESFENPVSNETGVFILKYSLLIIAVGEVAAPEGTTTQHTTTPWLNTK